MSLELKEQLSRVSGLIQEELQRQEEGLEMIPSENYASKAVLQACASVFSNKYSEGYPGKRYYGGNQVVDKVEAYAVELAKKLFDAEHVNVQPYSGSPANLAVYFALLETGDKILSLSLAHGGHLTHGHKVNWSGKMYDIINYEVEPDTHLIDMDKVAELAAREKPKLILSGFTAYPRTVHFKQFAKIAEEVGAISFSDISHIAGLVIGEQHLSPFPFTDVVTTTTHKTLRGPRGAVILCKEKFAKDIDRAVFPGMQGGPHEHTIAAKAVCFEEALQPEFKDYAAQIVKNSKAMARVLSDKGYALVSGGTDNHLILMDLSPKGITGKEAETALDAAGITVNKNMIPFDTRSPFDPSGIRFGTPALTTRGMKEPEMEQIADFMDDAIKNNSDKPKLAEIKEKVKKLCKEFPVYC